MQRLGERELVGGNHTYTISALLDSVVFYWPIYAASKAHSRNRVSFEDVELEKH